MINTNIEEKIIKVEGFCSPQNMVMETFWSTELNP